MIPRPTLSIFCISLVIYSLLISKGPVTTDCLSLAIKSQAAFETLKFEPLFGTGYPLMVIMGFVSIAVTRLFGITDPVFAVNLIGVLFGAAAVAALYAFTTRLFPRPAGYIAALFLLANPIFLDVSSYGIGHAPGLFFLLWGMCVLDDYQQHRRPRDLWLCGVLFGLFASTRLQDFFLILPAVTFAFRFGLRPSPPPLTSRRTEYALFGGIMTAVCLGLHLPFIQASSHYNAELSRFINIGLTHNFRGLFTDSLTAGFMAIMKSCSFLVLAVFPLGLYRVWKTHGWLLTFTLLTWLLVPFWFYGNLMSTAPRFFTCVLPAVIIPVSVLFGAMWSTRQMMPRILAVGIAAFMLYHPLERYGGTIVKRHTSSTIADFYTAMGQRTESNAVIITVDDGLFVNYYSKRQRMERPRDREILNPENLNRFQKALDGLLEQGIPVYITHMGLWTYDHTDTFKNFMNTHYHLTDLGGTLIDVWYITPFTTSPHQGHLFKIEKK